MNYLHWDAGEMKSIHIFTIQKQIISNSVAKIISLSEKPALLWEGNPNFGRGQVM